MKQFIVPSSYIPLYAGPGRRPHYLKGRVEYKLCAHCGQLFAISSSFYAKSDPSDRLDYYCKECRNEYPHRTRSTER